MSEKHSEQILAISKKENISIKAVEMITVSNSTVFINSNWYTIKIIEQEKWIKNFYYFNYVK